jgi:carboxylesterase type B
VDDEAAIFIPQNKSFSEVLNFFLPAGYSTERDSITTRYYNANDEAGSIKLLIRDAVFTCNTRYVYDGMSNKQKKIFLMHYGMSESVKVAVHATDLIPTFMNSVSKDSKLAEFLHSVTNASIPELAGYLLSIRRINRNYKRYFVQHAVSGDPNFAGAPARWLPPSQSGSFLANVMDVSNRLLTAFDPDFLDKMNSLDNCTQFWHGIAQSVQTSPSSYNAERLVVQNEHSHMNMEL